MKTGSARTFRPRAITSLVFPTYNPGEEIERTWKAVRDFVARSRNVWEILFVCDGCSDGTPDKLLRMTKDSGKWVRVLAYPENRGKGFAVRTGLIEAQGRWRIFADVDLAYGFDAICRVARVLRAGTDVAIASRDHPQSEWVLPPQLVRYISRRHRQSRIFGWLARTLLPIRHRDTQAGLKGLSRRAVEQIVPKLQCDGFGFDCELLTACSRLGIAVQEIPIRVHYRDAASTTGRRAMLGMIRELWQIRQDWRDVLPEPQQESIPIIHRQAA